MPFIANETKVFSFADYQDLVNRDQRLFEANEGLDQEVVEDALVRGTERILTELRATDWWVSYYVARQTNSTINTRADVPELNSLKIKSRFNDFTDLAVYYALYYYLLPRVADFGTEDNAERNKIEYYKDKYKDLFNDLIHAGDWYDFDGDAIIQSSEKQPSGRPLRRVR